MLSRRAVMAAGLAAAALSKAVASPRPRGALVPIRGTRLYVEDSGPRDAPALVYLHGGPGFGSYEFSHYSGWLLEKSWRLIVFDQRGVLRSDPMPKSQPYGMDDLVADTEALRRHLRIGKWSLLGHSFGGHYALRYALAHPERVDRLFLENSACSFPESARSSMQAVAALSRELGDIERAEKAEKLASSSLEPKALLKASGEVMNGLGENRQSLYLYDQRWRGYVGRLAAVSGLGEKRWTQGQVQAEKLFSEGKLLEPMLDRFAQWKGPTLLVKGETDHAASPEEIATVEALPRGRVVRIPRSGHFCHVEQPRSFAEALGS